MYLSMSTHVVYGQLCLLNKFMASSFITNNLSSLSVQIKSTCSCIDTIIVRVKGLTKYNIFAISYVKILHLLIFFFFMAIVRMKQCFAGT